MKILFQHFSKKDTFFFFFPKQEKVRTVLPVKQTNNFPVSPAVPQGDLSVYQGHLQMALETSFEVQ